MNWLRWFDLNDVHFYLGMAMLFAGLWLTWSLGLALMVTGGVMAGVGFVGALWAGSGAPRPTPPTNKGKH